MVATNDLDAALDAVESNMAKELEVPKGEYVIYAKNSSSRMKVSLSIYADNTLGEILSAASSELGIVESNLKPVFVNEETSMSTADTKLTAGEFGLKDGSILGISPYGLVAAN